MIHVSRKLLVFLIGFTFLFLLEYFMRPYALNGSYFQHFPSERMMQTVSVLDLRDAPLESLYYLHIQPPAFDTIRAVLVHLWPADDSKTLAYHVDQGLYVVWMIVYALLGTLVYTWLEQIVPTRVAFCATLLFYLHPAAIMYASFLETTMLSSLLVGWYLYQLWKISQHTGSILLFSLALLAVFFTRSIFQWPVLIVSALSLILLRVPRKNIILFLAIAGSIMTIYCIKQYHVFGTLATSTFAGLNCVRSIGTLDSVRDYVPQCEAYIENTYQRKNIPLPFIAPVGVLHRATKVPSPFSTTPDVNLNHVSYLVCNQEFLRRCKEQITTKPIIEILESYMENTRIYFLPSDHYTEHVIVDRLPWRLLYSAIFSDISLLILLGSSLAWWIQHHRQRMIVGVGILLPVLFVFAVSVLFEKGENMRFKFFLEPSLYVFMVSQLYPLVRSRWKWTPHNQRNGQ